jgi:hypothetical protein
MQHSAHGAFIIIVYDTCYREEFCFKEWDLRKIITPRWLTQKRVAFIEKRFLWVHCKIVAGAKTAHFGGVFDGAKNWPKNHCYITP